MDMKMSEIKARKEELEALMTAQIQDFEAQCEVSVSGTIFHKIKLLGHKGETDSVFLDVEII